MKENIKNQWRNLIADDRSFKKRICIAALPVFLLAYEYLLFGPLDIIVNNSQFIEAPFESFVLPFFICFIAAFFLITVAVSLTKGKIYDILICLLFGIALCSWLQATFLNTDLGTLDGKAIEWHRQTTKSLLNLMVWFVVCLLPFVFYYFFKPIFFKTTVLACAILVAMQTVALVSSVIAQPDKEDIYYLSADEQYVLSENENVIVFILDSFSNYIMSDVLKEHPQVMDYYKDFTYYTNNNTSYVGTFPAEMHMLTGWEYNADLPYEENFELAWNSERANKYYELINKAGYDVNIYAALPSYLGGSDLSRFDGKIANLRKVNSFKMEPTVIKQFIVLSLYRNSPLAMKAISWRYSGDLAIKYDSGKTAECDDTFYTALKQEGLSVSDGNNKLMYYMLFGAHAPFTMDRYGNFAPEGTSGVEQATGYMLILSKYLDQMKALGIYDDATIIITADHGDTTNTQSIFMIKRKGDSFDSMQYNSAPVSHREFQSTILELLSIDNTDFGLSIYDFNENDQRERMFTIWDEYDDLPDIGKYNVLRDYVYTGNELDALEALKKDPYAVRKLLDSFY